MGSADGSESASRGSMYCWRCDDAVRAIRPWDHWNKIWIVWCCVIGGMTLIFPVMSSDYCVMIPTMMGIIVAGGPIYRYAHEQPSCSVCSAILDPARKHGTGVRAKNKTTSPEGEAHEGPIT